MAVSQDQNNGREARRQPASPARVVGGAALMLIGVALMSYGAHYLAKTGTCSGTGYTEYGPVPKCGSGEALYIMSAFFMGPVAAVLGWLIARAWGWLWPAFCVGVGVGLVTLRFDATVTSGAKAFAILSGECLFALAVISVIVSVRKRRRQAKTGPVAMSGPGARWHGPGTAAVASGPGSFQSAPAWAPGASEFGSDAFDKITKLAQLRDIGALTEEEFEHQKARLLAQM